MIRAGLDLRADVLYLSLGKPIPDEGEDRSCGIVLRYSVEDDHPSGVTVIGYDHFGWRRNLKKLAAIVSEHLSVAPEDAVKAIRQAEEKTN